MLGHGCMGGTDLWYCNTVLVSINIHHEFVHLNAMHIKCQRTYFAIMIVTS